MRGIPRLQIELVEPDGLAGELAPGPVARGVRHVRATWRPWMTMAVLIVVLGAASVVPVPVRVFAPHVVVDAGTAVTVDVDTRTNPDGTRSAHTGTYLIPASSGPEAALDVLVGIIRPDRRASRVPAPHPFAPDPVEAALVTAAGVAPGRARPADLGLTARIDSHRVDPAALGVLLEVFDQASTTDLSDGRVILALGTVAADGALACSPDAAASLRTAGDIDLVLRAEGCPDIGEASDVTVHEVASFPDALGALAAGG